jgi:hypothetical protein
MKPKINISFLFIACAIPLAIFILPIIGYKQIIYKLDTYSPFWIFSLQLGLGLLLSIKLSRDFYTWLKELISCHISLVPVLLVVLFAITASIAFIESRSRVQVDESIHYIIAQNLYHNQIGQICYEGSYMENGFACVLGQTIKTRGLSYIYMLGMPFFGKHLYWVYTLHLFFLALALLSFYLALLAWLRQHSLALIATALLASCPILLFCFRSASVEPFYVTMFCLSLLFLKWAYDGNTTRHWLLLALILAFFAQTRSETVFCLFAFVGVVLYRKKFSILNFQFSAFLATLSLFSLPVLCTLSYNRDSDLQGGSLGAHGHLFSNIVSDFKIMALPHFSNDGILKYPFLPYFTWLAIFGLITLIVLTIKEFRSKKPKPQTPYPKPYKYITAFLLLLAPQYLILFDGVSADLNMSVQWRFALIILPVMSFLGALFLCRLGAVLQSQFSIFNSQLRPQIVLYGAVFIILTTCIAQYKTFVKDIPNIGNYAAIEDYELHKWIRQEPPKRMLFFYWNKVLLLTRHSAYSYQTLLSLNSEDLEEILEEYKGEVYFVNASNCDAIVGIAKMQSPNTFRLCDRSIRYFNTQEVFSKKIVEHFKPLSIHKILGFNDIDSLGLLRILNKVEPTDNTVNLYFKVPKERSEPWKVQHFVNDSLILESPYKKRDYTDTYNISLFDKDTNVWKLTIIDTITGAQIHSDFWELLRVR